MITRQCERAGLVEVVEQVAPDDDDDLVGDQQHPLVEVFACQRVAQRADPQGDIHPALPAGGAVVELAEPPSALGLEGLARSTPAVVEQVEHAELAFAQSLVGVDRQIEPGLTRAAMSAVCTARTYGDEITTCGGGARSTPASAPNAVRLFDTERGQRDVHVALGDVEHLELRRASTVARHVAEALSMTQQPELDRITDHGHVRTRHTL